MPEAITRKRRAITDIELYEGRTNYKWARNTNLERDIRLTYQVTGLPHGPRNYTEPILAGDETELGIINAGGGQILRYRKISARYLN